MLLSSEWACSSMSLGLASPSCPCFGTLALAPCPPRHPPAPRQCVETPYKPFVPCHVSEPSFVLFESHCTARRYRSAAPRLTPQPASVLPLTNSLQHRALRDLAVQNASGWLLSGYALVRNHFFLLATGTRKYSWAHCVFCVASCGSAWAAQLPVQ